MERGQVEAFGAGGAKVRVLIKKAAPFRILRRAVGGANRDRRAGKVRSVIAGFAAAAEIEVERGGLFLLLPVLLGTGAIFYFTFPYEPGWIATAIALTAAIGLAVIVRALSNYPLALGAAAVCLIVAGFAAGKAETSRLSTKMLGQAVTTRVSGQVVRVDRLANGRGRILLDVAKTERPKLRYAPERVRVTGKLPEALRPGMTISGLVRLQPPSGPVMPGGYDFSFRSFFDGIGANGFFLGQPTIDGENSNAAGWLEGTRDAIAARIRSVIGGAEGEIAAALIVGVRGGIPNEVNEALRRTGLAHILSISGVHMALVAATVMGMMRAAFGAFPLFASRRAVKKASAAGALAAVSIYLLFSGAEVAAVRSYIMLAVMLLAVFFDQAALTMRNLAIAAIAILLWSPHEILGPSFQMSFAATAALIAAYGAWADFRGARPTNGQASVAGSLAAKGSKLILALAATSIIAGAATAVFSIYHFHQTAWLGLPANLLVMPVVSLLVMPAAILAMLAMPFGADAVFLWLMGVGLRAMLSAADWLANMSPADSIGSIPASTMILTSLAIAVVAVATTRLRLLAVPPFLAALAVAALAVRPDVLISEDGRMVGVRMRDDLAVSASRGGGFALENWQRALGGRIVRAEQPTAGDGAEASSSRRPSGQGAFQCEGEICRMSDRDRGPIVHARSVETSQPPCAAGITLIVNDPSFGACPAKHRPALTLDSRRLARRGAAAIWLAGPEAGTRPTVEHAIPQPYRPWHMHRKFSRAARGMKEPERRVRPAAPKSGAELPD